jgi:excisionase family DNA binding protein
MGASGTDTVTAPPLLLTKAAAAKLLGVSRPTLDAMIAAGDIPPEAVYQARAMTKVRLVRAELERLRAPAAGRKRK